MYFVILPLSSTIKSFTFRHIQIVTVVKSSTALVCEMYAAKGPSKVLHLRIDSLARMLTLANVHANSRVLVVETTQGLLVSAVLERMGGTYVWKY